MQAVERERESLNAPLRGLTTPTYYDPNTLSGSIGYELDCGARYVTKSPQAKPMPPPRGLDLENARLSLTAQLADNYIQLRSLDRAGAILNDTVQAYTRALGLTRQRHDAGIAPGLDVSQAQTQLEVAQSRRPRFWRNAPWWSMRSPPCLAYRRPRFPSRPTSSI